VSMAGRRILSSVQKVRAFARGESGEGFVVHVPDEVDVRAIRKQLALTRVEFASRFGVSPTLRRSGKPAGACQTVPLVCCSRLSSMNPRRSGAHLPRDISGAGSAQH